MSHGPLLVGADGCRGGYLAAVSDGGGVRIEVVAGADGLLSLGADIVAVDMPIGLVERGPRAPDVAARGRLRGRASTLFNAPVRPALAGETYAEANRLSREAGGVGLSAQSYGFLPKVRDMDLAVRGASEEVRARVWETHPEVAFATLAGGPLRASKHTAEGLAVREGLLGEVFGAEAVARVLAARPRSVAKADDVLDALACLWTAGRIARGESEAVLEGDPRDGFGLRMNITF